MRLSLVIDDVLATVESSTLSPEDKCRLSSLAGRAYLTAGDVATILANYRPELESIDDAVLDQLMDLALEVDAALGVFDDDETYYLDS